jgi:hypothetical protein
MKKIIFLFSSLLAFGSANAQTSNGQTVAFTIPPVALIKVSGTVGTFAFTAPAAGDNMIDATASGTTVQYTSILSSATDRAVYVTATGTAVKGFNLSVRATNLNNTANSNGTTGVINASESYIVKSADGVVTNLNTGSNAFGSSVTTNQKILTGILSCYTGSNTTDGPQLTYRASIGSPSGPTIASADYAALRSGTYTFVVYYTLADNV